MEKITYKELREKHGKRMILEWRKMCTLFNYDPATTVAFEIAPVTEEPSIALPDQVSGSVPAPEPELATEFLNKIGIDVDGDGKVDQVVTIERPTTVLPVAPEKEAE